MPDLVLTEDSKQYQELAGDFARNEIAPKAHQFDASGAFPVDICKKAWEIGLLNVRMPESLGGLGLSVFDAAVMAEELGAACLGMSSAFWGNDLAVAPLLVAGTEEQLNKFLAPAAEKFQLLAHAFQRPSLGALTAEKKGAAYSISGKAVCINASQAPWIVAVAGNSVFVIPANDPGVHLGERPSGIGLKCADLRHVDFDKVEVADSHLIGTASGAKQVMDKAHAAVYPVLASYIAGLTRSALEHAVRYSKERHTMGQAIANHQAVGFMLADIAKDLEATRFMARKAAWCADHQGGDLQSALMSKSFACNAATKAAIDAVQVFGGYGYSREYPVEKLMRDAKMMQVYEYGGSNDQITIGESLLEAARS